MATQRDIQIRRNRLVTLTIDVSGVTSWTGMQSKLYIASSVGGSILLEVNCNVVEVDEQVQVVIMPYDTYSLTGTYYYEVVLYKADLNYLKTLMYGKCRISNVIKLMS